MICLKGLLVCGLAMGLSSCPTDDAPSLDDFLLPDSVEGQFGSLEYCGTVFCNVFVNCLLFSFSSSSFRCSFCFE